MTPLVLPIGALAFIFKLAFALSPAGLVAHAAPAPVAAAYKPGDKLRPIEGVGFDKSRSTLVVFVKESCDDCTASMEFYKRLVGGERRAKIIALSYDSADVLGRYLEKQGFNPDQAASIPDQGLKIESTPTLLLVSPDMTIQKVWTGKLVARDEYDITRAVR
jgi:peroxiredoxin